MIKKQYIIKEIFYSLQGEGMHSGTPAIFVRFSGCNLWSGREEDRINAICKFCDTDFVGYDGENGGKYLLHELVGLLNDIRSETKCKFLIFTGGEPTLQIDEKLIDELHKEEFFISLETNGTNDVLEGIDWITVSPKYGSTLKQNHGNELKLVFPQDDLNPNIFMSLDFDNYYLQPKESLEYDDNLKLCLDYCLQNPDWKLSLQTHKYLNIK
ncbi:MAG: 7-carboxy-7-deazaguanine synthase [Saprospiraceae bacterium]